jgi:GNAT superfamily N-acetyltransferase
MTIQVRVAREEDAETLAEVNIRSIREVCGPDYPDPAHLDDWCANKTPENFRKWIAQSHTRVLAGLVGDRIGGIGMVDLEKGFVYMLYLVPEALGHGLGKAMLAEMERLAAAAGRTKLELQSTITARTFYESQGYTNLGEVEHRDKPSYKMEKALTGVLSPG